MSGVRCQVSGVRCQEPGHSFHRGGRGRALTQGWLGQAGIGFSRKPFTLNFGYFI